MEESSYMCSISHLDGDTRLPPRKRLLAGLKKQNSDSASPSPSPPTSVSSSYSTRLQNLLNSSSETAGLSPDEIVDASKSAALAAAKVAAAAKAKAVEKAEAAAKAVAAAKNALALVASVSEETSLGERDTRKNRPKKHVPVELLYKKRRSRLKCETDEELARKLHQAMNSSPRISKGSLRSNLKVHNHKRHKKQHGMESSGKSDGGKVMEGHSPSLCDRIAEASDVNGRGPVMELFKVGKIEMKDHCAKSDHTDMDSAPPNGETEPRFSKEKEWRLEERSTTGRKRGRIRQKKLSLSLCAIKDRENPKEEAKCNGFPSMKEPRGNCASEMPFFAANPPTEDPTVTTGSAL